MLWVVGDGDRAVGHRHAAPHLVLCCDHHGLCVPGQGASSGHRGGWGAPQPEGSSQPGPPLPPQAPQPRAELGVVPAPPPDPGVLLLPLCTPGPLPVLRGPPSTCRTPTFPQAPQASCCPRSHVPLPTGPHPVPQQGPRHQPTCARHRGVTHLNLGCREIAGAAGPQGDIHPEANLGPAFLACSASCQALGPPGPLQTPPCS